MRSSGSLRRAADLLAAGDWEGAHAIVQEILHRSRRGCTGSSTCSRATSRMRGTGTGVRGARFRVRAPFNARSRRCGRRQRRKRDDAASIASAVSVDERDELGILRDRGHGAYGRSAASTSSAAQATWRNPRHPNPPIVSAFELATLPFGRMRRHFARVACEDRGGSAAQMGLSSAHVAFGCAGGQCGWTACSTSFSRRTGKRC
jgi:hypothetical protein